MVEKSDWILTPEFEQMCKDRGMNVPQPCPQCKDIRVWYHSDPQLDTAPFGPGGDIIQINYCPFCGYNLLKKEPPMPEKPLCKDCKWIGDCRMDHGHATCGAPKAARSLVYDESIQKCGDLRHPEGCIILGISAELCGPEGRWFEAKEITDLGKVGLYYKAIFDHIENLVRLFAVPGMDHAIPLTADERKVFIDLVKKVQEQSSHYMTC